MNIPQPIVDDSTPKSSIVPVILFLLMILAGTIIAFLSNNENDLQRYCFIILISLGAGLGATYLTGNIMGKGTFGFLNLQSATGGFAVWLITLATFLYFYPHNNLKKVPNMNGKWLYVCSGHTGKYQHGGRFTATQTDDAWSLKGERMWKDTFNFKKGKWDSSISNPTKSWHSLSGNIDNNEIRCEYIVENVSGEDIHGYFHGPITLDNKNNVIKVKGTFNQLYPSKQISGDIEFFKVEDDKFNNPTWVKNHNCNN